MGKDYLYYKTKLIKGTNGEGKSILPIIKRNFGPLRYYDSLRAIIHNINYTDYFKGELFPQNINDIITYDSIPLSFDDEHITEKIL